MTLAKILTSATVTMAITTVAYPATAANDLQYDIQDQRNAAMFEQLIWNTRSCMKDGANGMLMQGVRDSSTITTFVQKVCGGSLSSFMTKTLQRPDTEIVAFIQSIAYDELNRIPGLTHSSSSPKSAKQLEKITVFTISTFKNGQPIGMRKTEAAELYNAAITLTNTFQKQVPSYELLVSVAKGMTAKDRCFNLYSSMVALASIEAGILDTSQNTEMFLKNSISSIEAVNNQTKITCEMR